MFQFSLVNYSTHREETNVLIYSFLQIDLEFFKNIFSIYKWYLSPKKYLGLELNSSEGYYLSGHTLGCRFARFIHVADDTEDADKVFDLRQLYYILFAKGRAPEPNCESQKFCI